MIPKSGYRFAACAKPGYWLGVSVDASAGEGRSDKIMLTKTQSEMPNQPKFISL
jgi:hypothetical protein